MTQIEKAESIFKEHFKNGAEINEIAEAFHDAGLFDEWTESEIYKTFIRNKTRKLLQSMTAKANNTEIRKVINVIEYHLEGPKHIYVSVDEATEDQLNQVIKYWDGISKIAASKRDIYYEIKSGQLLLWR